VGWGGDWGRTNRPNGTEGYFQREMVNGGDGENWTGRAEAAQTKTRTEGEDCLARMVGLAFSTVTVHLGSFPRGDRCIIG